MRALSSIAFASALLLGACVSSPQQQGAIPAFYQRLDAAQARFDPHSMAALINAWRAKHHLPALALDSNLMDEAMKAARRDADQDRSVHGVMPVLARADASQQIARPSAGYRTAAEAFSGWRDSPGLNAAMLDRQARRLGLGAAYKAGSKYGVYWMLIVAP
jgi:uncharacterized protein YkwD